MASGCIVSDDCPICHWLIYEDEWDGNIYKRYGAFVHKSCAGQYLKNESTEEYEAYINRLLRENEKLLEQNIELKKKLKKQVLRRL